MKLQWAQTLNCPDWFCLQARIHVTLGGITDMCVVTHLNFSNPKGKSYLVVMEKEGQVFIWHRATMAGQIFNYVNRNHVLPPSPPCTSSLSCGSAVLRGMFRLVYSDLTGIKKQSTEFPLLPSQTLSFSKPSSQTVYFFII
ncbi:hypothetical protein AMECASPLE_009796 [Ameca splendens]|uniref:Uncharacterized protein n=1 Tax=Ameca splendens TaxID=208324 RepID=A0ABV0Z9U0_9TELE